MVRSGLAGARTRDIAAEADITVATLHYYFPTKDDLVRAVLAHAIRERMVAPLGLEVEWDDGLAALRTMLEGIARQAEADPGHFRLLDEMVWAAKQDAALRAMLAEWHQDWHGAVAGWLSAGQRAGTVRADLDPGTVATMIIYLMHGVVTGPPVPRADDLFGQLERFLAPPHP
jgi:TetR/AcrR family transcriptional regulator, regulator of cefoperazone and chloramphenicol sensitivity